MSAARRRRGYPDILEGDVVIAPLARVHRNIAGYAFPGRNQKHAEEIVQAVVNAIEAEFPGCGKPCEAAELPDNVPLRAPLPESSPCFFIPSLNTRIIVNAFDHLAISATSTDGDVASAYAAADAVETMLGRHLAYAWRPDIGYLTSSPTDVGTAMRAGAIMHLEGLHLIGELEPSMRGLGAMRMDGIALDAGGIRQVAHVFRVVNGITLGEDEPHLVARSARTVEALCEQELNARLRLVEELPRVLADSISRALAILKNARLLSATEVMDLLSPVRLGASLGFIAGITPEEIDRIACGLPIFAPEEKDADTRDRLDGERADEIGRRFARVAPNARYTDFLS